jgi:hypothetical protein
MSLDPLNDPATQREILHLRVCATVLGKLLIKQGVLKKDDIAKEVVKMIPGRDKGVQDEIKNTMATFANW